ncbi:MAG: 4'-phosphopantetheinyl transferase superfamily protein, partial [Mesorhizobium sp.]
MRIVGLGSDLVSVERIRYSLTHLGMSWASKVLGPAELARAPASDDAEYVARLFAGKEACSKALGTGLAKGVHWTCINIELPGKVVFSQDALRRMKRVVGKNRQGLM